jgi:DNA-binding response OmpR family regulator
MPSSKATILVAEDDAFLMKVYKNKLTGLNYNLLTAGDGEEALKIAQEEIPSIILLDLVMPKKNGFEVLEALKAEKTTTHIPVIILSNLGQDGDVEKGKKLGAVDYIIKANVAIDEVVRKIEEHLSQSSVINHQSSESGEEVKEEVSSQLSASGTDAVAAEVDNAGTPAVEEQASAATEPESSSSENAFCSDCGKPVVVGAKFCSGCGKAV